VRFKKKSHPARNPSYGRAALLRRPISALLFRPRVNFNRPHFPPTAANFAILPMRKWLIQRDYHASTFFHFIR
jgi:hypothetical protein